MQFSIGIAAKDSKRSAGAAMIVYCVRIEGEKGWRPFTRHPVE